MRKHNMRQPIAATRNLLVIVSIFCCCAALPNGSEAATYFSTDFNATPLHAALGEDVNGSYTVTNGTSLPGDVIHCATCGGGLDRRYVRTNDSDYNTADFIYQVTFNNSGDGISFIGMGEGTGIAGTNEPADAVFWRILSDQIWFGHRNGASQTLELVSAVAPDTIYRARITKRGDLIQFQLDGGNDGTFEYSPSTVVDLNSSQFDYLDPDEHPEHGRLFFGTAFAQREFDDMSVGRFGDMNDDGAVDSNDVPLFVMALTNRQQYESEYGMSPDLRGDIDGSGTFDLGDVGPLSQLVGSTSSAAAVPEPNAVTLVVGPLVVIALRCRVGGRRVRARWPAATSTGHRYFLPIRRLS